jgi:hypothetical protein
MAFVQIVTIPGVTTGQYDRVIELAYGGEPVDGELFHVAGQSDAGWWVIDGWESREQCERSFEQLMPALQEVGISMSEAPQEFEIHRLTLGKS